MATYIKPEAIKDASLPIGKVAAMSENERLAFLVSLGLGKIGVVSQKQNWASDYSGYTLTEQVYGIIPQSVIDEWKSHSIIMSGSGFITYVFDFNENTGYFTIDVYQSSIGIIGHVVSDISYLEAVEINRSDDITSGVSVAKKTRVRYGLDATKFWEGNVVLTTIGNSNGSIQGVRGYAEYMICNSWAYSRPLAIKMNTFGYDKLIYVGNMHIFPSSGNMLDMSLCKALRTLLLYHLKSNLKLPNAHYIENESILFMITNSAATTDIVITLHADAYARAMADADIQSALASHPLVSLASA